MTDTSNIFLTGMLALQPRNRLVQKAVTILPQRTEIKHYYSHLSEMQILLHPSLRLTTTNTPQKRKNLFGFVDVPVTPEQATRANFKLFR
jgi:hypothetical protein